MPCKAFLFYIQYYLAATAAIAVTVIVRMLRYGRVNLTVFEELASLRREELVNGERDAVEQIARIIIRRAYPK